MGTVGLSHHPWSCGDEAMVIAGPAAGIIGEVVELRVGQRYQTILVIRVQNGDEYDADGEDVIPWGPA